MHKNSLAAFNSLDTKTRKHIILRLYELHGPQTDRQILQKLDFYDMNAVRPRISELIDEGILKECGDTLDEETGRTVRVVRVKLQSEITQQELFGPEVLNYNNRVNLTRR